VRQSNHIVSVAAIIAVGVNSDGRREVLGLDIGVSEAEPFWSEFLGKLTRRGLRGVKLVISDAHEGIKAAVSKVLSSTWQRCRVHFMRNALAHAGKSGTFPRRRTMEPAHKGFGSGLILRLSSRYLPVNSSIRVACRHQNKWQRSHLCPAQRYSLV
jgi:transposase-like protein